MNIKQLLTALILSAFTMTAMAQPTQSPKKPKTEQTQKKPSAKKTISQETRHKKANG
ncbi:hypothetical protein [Moraxella lacunata]|uniref:hypothetical protein n=1 Tax=Moraxella lacunata TaxID=477 RepID=UPI000A626042|nr:hypothetical protein [Moraxella lacunata]